MKKITEYIAIIVVTTFLIYTIILRFNNPEFTETQLFLKIIGM